MWPWRIRFHSEFLGAVWFFLMSVVPVSGYPKTLWRIQPLPSYIKREAGVGGGDINKEHVAREGVCQYACSCIALPRQEAFGVESLSS